MSMKSMAKKKMGAFMCHSPAATAVCMTPDSRSVIIPGRRSTTERNIITTATTFSDGTSDHSERLFDRVKYTKLIDYHNHRNPRGPPPHPHHYQSQTKFISANNSGTTTNNNKAVILPNSMIKRERQALRSVLSSSTSDHQQIIRPLDLQKPSLVLDSVSDHVFQVVVMRVSLHCQGCAGKLKKQLSKMEGVTSFSIELETKRVTVMGHVSPAGVLESISKFRRAEFWPSSFPADQHSSLT